MILKQTCNKSSGNIKKAMAQEEGCATDDRKIQNMLMGSLSELGLNSSETPRTSLSNSSDLLLFNHDDSIFELPLKDKYNLKGSNFSELNDDLLATHVPVLSHPSKKVRFENSDNVPDQQGDTEEEGSGSTTSVSHQEHESDRDSLPTSPHTKSRIEVENLLEKANAFNEFVSENIERMNPISSEILAPPRINSQGRMGSDARSDSISGFALSDSEYDADSVLERVNSQNTNDPFTHSNIESQLGGTFDNLRNSPVYTGITNNFVDDDNSGSTSNNNYTEFEEFEIQVPDDFKPNALKKADIQDNQSLLFSKYGFNSELNDISVEEALENYLETLELIINNSKDESKLAAYMDDDPHYETFSMRSAPSIEYRRFVQRIQNKCMFGSIIYLGATYLVQILFLKREDQNGPVRLKRRLHENEIHRVIIGTIRISTKLLEDFVHSHEYICKVCGISKKLMTKIELALIFCLKNDNLLVNSAKLMATKYILDDLRAMN